MIKNFFRKENGSITLFVLIAMLFFLFVVFAMFMRSSNSNMAQTSEIDQIKEEYEESVNNIDQIYNETLIANLSSLLKPGDYVNYTYDAVEDGYSLSSTYSGYSSNQTINQSEELLQWQILSVNSDGTVDLISTSPTNESVYFQGALGYNNGVLLLNDICEKLYSNSNLGIEARSINIEDIEKQLNNEANEAINNFTSTVKYVEANTYSGSNSNYPSLYTQENGSGIDTTEIKTDGINVNDNGYTGPTTQTSNVATDLTVTQTYYYFQNMQASYFKDNDGTTSKIRDLLFNTNTSYWLASRSVNSTPTSASFNLNYIDTSSLTANIMFNSNLDNSNNTAGYYHLRPIISLNIEQIQPCTGTADGTNETIEHMHQIKE